MPGIWSLDTETTGLDLKHGAKPFLVTFSNEDGDHVWYEWDVDPCTRQPKVNDEDLRDIVHTIDESEALVFHNASFDTRALSTIMPWYEWDWNKIHDTLYMSHLASSATAHDLSSLVLEYLRHDISKLERHIKETTKDAIKEAKKIYPEWMYAKETLPCMPSVTGDCWKNDMWLPRCLAQREGYPVDHPWYTACSKYANGDSGATLPLFKRLRNIIQERNQWDIYLFRLKLLPIVYDMEEGGISYSQQRLSELIDKFSIESDSRRTKCIQIAKKWGHDLVMPKSGNNDSLKELIFDKFGCEVVKRSKKTGKPALDREVLEHYEATMTEESDQVQFIQALREKRKRDTALNYMYGYRRHRKRVGRSKNWFYLHPSVNPTGTHTLRWSSNNPNSQNMSKQEGFNLRYAFGPLPGREWWSIDYDNIELRIPAYESQEPAMLELFEKPNEPPYFGSYHLLTFSILHPDKYDHDDPEGLVKAKSKYKSTWYQWTKNGGFALLYGAIESSGTADKAFHVQGAQRILEDRLTEKKRLNEFWVEFARNRGYVETLPDKEIHPERGYRIGCPRNEWGKISPTIPLNYHVQGTACWVMSKAMVLIHDYLKNLDGYRMIMNVHDEVVLDFPHKEDYGNLPIVRDIGNLMQNIGKDIDVPLTVGIDYHRDNWSVSESLSMSA